MRFTLVKDLKRDALMVPLLWGLLLFWLLFLVVDVMQTHAFLGLTFEAVYMTLDGNSEEFIEPLAFTSLLEYVHLSIFFSMMVVVTLAATFGRLCLRKKFKIISVFVMLLAALISPVALLTHAVELFVISYYVWHAVALLLVLLSMIKLIR